MAPQKPLHLTMPTGKKTSLWMHVNTFLLMECTCRGIQLHIQDTWKFLYRHSKYYSATINTHSEVHAGPADPTNITGQILNSSWKALRVKHGVRFLLHDTELWREVTGHAAIKRHVTALQIQQACTKMCMAFIQCCNLTYKKWEN